MPNELQIKTDRNKQNQTFCFETKSWLVYLTSRAPWRGKLCPLRSGTCVARTCSPAAAVGRQKKLCVPSQSWAPFIFNHSLHVTLGMNDSKYFKINCTWMGCPIKLKLSEHFHDPIYKSPPCLQGGGGQGNSEKFNLSKLTIKLKKISNWLIFLSFVKKRF